MTLYRANDSAAASDLKGWDASTFYGRFTQRLIAALSAHTAEGGLYEVDLQLRPSGTAGPVAVSRTALERERRLLRGLSPEEVDTLLNLLVRTTANIPFVNEYDPPAESAAPPARKKRA